MAQITFEVAVEQTTGDVAADATTSGPIQIPQWAPDIAYISTTTVHDHQSILLATTGDIIPLSPDGGYNTRCFGLKTGRHMEAGKLITIEYQAVGELVRT